MEISFSKSNFYICKNGDTLKLDSEWESIVAKRLDDLNLNWYRPRIRIPYIDNNGIEKGYFPDFYVEDYKCFIEVKSPYISKRQNKNGKIDYLKSHYSFIFWIESELDCSTFELKNLHYNESVEKEVSDIIENYKIKKDNEIKKRKTSTLRIDKELEIERWNIIQNSNIDFQSFGWVKEISLLFGIATNKSGKYIKFHYPEFYKTCYKRKSPTNQNDKMCELSN